MKDDTHSPISAGESAADYFESNKTAAALLRDSETAYVHNDGPPPVDLRALPRENWGTVLQRHVTLPEGVRAFLDGHDGSPLASSVVHALEETVESYHGVTAPWCILSSPAIQSSGRAWRYVPEAAPYLTGFVLMKEDGSFAP